MILLGTHLIHWNPYFGKCVGVIKLRFPVLGSYRFSGVVLVIPN